MGGLNLGIDGTCLWNHRGFGRFTTELLRAMAAVRGEHRLTLVVDREPAAGEIPEGCQVINAQPRRLVTRSAVAGGRRSLMDMRAFTRAVRGLQPDVFFFPAVYSFFPLPRNTPAVVCFHDTIAESFPRLIFPNRRSRWSWAAKVRLALRQSTRVMTVSEASRNSLLQRFHLDPDNVDLVTEGPGAVFRVLSDRARIAATMERLGLPPGCRYVLHVGGLSPHKNLAALVRAMSRLAQAEDVHLVLAGDDKADGFLANAGALRQLAASLPGMAHRCHFTGFISDDDLALLYNGAYILAFPSLAEGFGLPAVEAMACGLPVAASRVGSLPEVIGDAGLFFAPEDETEMAGVMGRLLQDHDLRENLARRAVERAALFTWERAATMAYDSLQRAVG